MSKTTQGADSSQQNINSGNQNNQGKPQSYGTIPSQRGATQSGKKTTK
jgi:hypothetical protein